MRKLFLCPVLLLCFGVFAQKPWRQELRYVINARLEDDSRRLTGTMELSYSNRSPDTLAYLWFHTWPNAYKSDRTDYSDQLLENGKTRFYFAPGTSRGYLNQLEFRVGPALAQVEDHPEYIDVVKVTLPAPLAPGDSVRLQIHFQDQLPENFSGFGYTGHHYELTNWYPEPAVYDSGGWHPMPFLEQGAGYHEAAAFDVTLSLPAGYVPAAGAAPVSAVASPRVDWHYRLPRGNGFAWAADKRFSVITDSLILSSGRTVRLRLYYQPRDSLALVPLLAVTKQLLSTGSRALTDYPLADLTLVDAVQPTGASFAGIIFLNAKKAGETTRQALARAVCAQWFEAFAAPDVRGEPWLTFGFTDHYARQLMPATEPHPRDRWADERVWLQQAARDKSTQPLSTPAAGFSPANYQLVPHTEAGQWFDRLALETGDAAFSAAARAYLAASIFQPADVRLFRAMLRQSAPGRSFTLSEPTPAPARPLPFLPLGKYNGHTYPLLPAAGYNRYDGVMIGLLLHNYRWPSPPFQFMVLPLYATETKTINVTARLAYAWAPGTDVRKVTIGVNGSRFSTDRSTDSSGKAIFTSVVKIVPYLRVDLQNGSPRATVEKQLLFRTYLFEENGFEGYALSATDGLFHPNSVSNAFRYLNELSFRVGDDRALYPYEGNLAVQQAAEFYRINLTARYLFNYASGGGLAVRFFAAKFGQWNRSYSGDLTRYQPKLLGVTGDEDYTYDEYFAGRSASYAFEKGPVYNGGLPAQQIYNRDGGLKLRIDPFDYAQGRSADWVTALNLSTTLPAKLFPFKLPVRLFFDFGTYAEAWETNPSTSRFLYTGGVQLTIFHDVLNIYAPLIYSSDFTDLVRQEGFGKRITFSVDIQALDRAVKRRTSYHAD